MICFWKRAPKTPSVAAQIVIDLLQNPAEWTFDEYRARHTRGASIWIGNPDLVWARHAYIPGAGRVVQQGDNCRATIDNKALHKAVFAARDLKAAMIAEAYAAPSSASQTPASDPGMTNK